MIGVKGFVREKYSLLTTSADDGTRDDCMRIDVLCKRNAESDQAAAAMMDGCWSL